ncbi:MAG: hypothetical protein WCD79_03035 [Chthoniobacteraceae bacterium]
MLDRLKVELMQRNNISQHQKDMDALAAQIDERVVENGYYLLEKEGLELIWGKREWDFERRLILQNFVLHYGFEVMLVDIEAPPRANAKARGME